jgi:hypothetical protein
LAADSSAVLPVFPPLRTLLFGSSCSALMVFKGTCRSAISA